MKPRWIIPTAALVVAIAFGGLYLRPDDAGPTAGDVSPRAIVGDVGDVTGRPIANARVWIDGGSGDARTDSHGRFRIDGAPPGLHIVRVEAASYVSDQQTIQLAEADAQAEVAFRLSLDAQ